MGAVTVAFENAEERGRGGGGGEGGQRGEVKWQKKGGVGWGWGLTHKLAVSAVLWKGAVHEVQQAAVTPRATRGPHLGICQLHLPGQHIPCPPCMHIQAAQRCVLDNVGGMRGEGGGGGVDGSKTRVKGLAMSMQENSKTFAPAVATFDLADPAVMLKSC